MSTFPAKTGFPPTQAHCPSFKYSIATMPVECNEAGLYNRE